MSILAIFALIGSTATPPFDLANHTVVATFHAQGGLGGPDMDLPRTDRRAVRRRQNRRPPFRRPALGTGRRQPDQGQSRAKPARPQPRRYRVAESRRGAEFRRRTIGASHHSLSPEYARRHAYGGLRDTRRASIGTLQCRLCFCPVRRFCAGKAPPLQGTGLAWGLSSWLGVEIGEIPHPQPLP